MRLDTTKLDAAVAKADSLGGGGRYGGVSNKTPKYKVGQVVDVKYDVEQSGKIEKINFNSYGEPQYLVRCRHGEYVDDHERGELVAFLEQDLR